MQYIVWAKIVYWDVSAAPSCDTACLKFEEAIILEALLEKHKTKNNIEKALCTPVANSYHSLDYEQNATGIMHNYTQGHVSPSQTTFLKNTHQLTKTYT